MSDYGGPLLHFAVLLALMLKWTLAVDNHLDQSPNSKPPIFIDHGLAPGSKGCQDNDAKCSIWANQGECESNAAWMMANCRRSCQSCQGGERAWKLRAHIARNYDNETTENRFAVNQVDVQSFHLDHMEVDEKSQTSKIRGRIVLTWNDTKLAWSKSEWGISWLDFYWIQIWTPRLFQRNAIGGQESQVEWKTLAANYTGQVYMWADYVFTSACPLDYLRYPKDSQECCFQLDDKRYFVVNFNVSENAIKTAKRSVDVAHVSGWKVKNVEITSNPYKIEILQDWRKDPFNFQTTNCQVCVKFRRRTTYHSAEIIGPCVATAIVTLTSFFLNSFTYQVWMLVSSLGLQILALQTLDAKLPPPTEGTPNVVKFYNINLAITCFILVSMALLMWLSTLRSTLPPPHCLDRFINCMGRFCPCIDNPQLKDGEQHSLENGGPPRADTGLTKGGGGGGWSPLARALRFLLFAVFLIVYILAMLGCLG